MHVLHNLLCRTENRLAILVQFGSEFSFSRPTVIVRYSGVIARMFTDFVLVKITKPSLVLVECISTLFATGALHSLPEPAVRAAGVIYRKCGIP